MLNTIRKLAGESYHWAKSGLRTFKIGYSKVLNLAYRFRLLNIYNVPIVINNFNRLTSLRQLAEFLDRCGFTNIVILDNNSTFPPLLEYYDHCKFKVIRTGINFGHLAFWKSDMYRKYKWNYFVYTDSDVLPISECPSDFIEYFKTLLDEEDRLDKIGFGIKIDDLPDSFFLKKKVYDYELRYWKNEIKPNLYNAPVDTTFALYRPFSNLKFGLAHTLAALRVGFPYLIRHLPWYVDSQNLSAEELYYMETCNKSSSIGSQWKGEGEVY